MRVTEHEITEPVDLCRPDGRLNPAAVGWTRHPLHDTSRIGAGRYGWGRNKRWEYWAVTTPTHLVGVTVSSLDYAGVHAVWVHDRRTGETVSHDAIDPLSRGATLPGRLGDDPARARTKDLSIDVVPVPDGTRLEVTAPRVRLDVLAERPPGHEAMGVVVPWSPRLFQYTVKDVARPAVGRAVGRRHRAPGAGRRVVGGARPRPREVALLDALELGRGVGRGRRSRHRGAGRRPVDRRHRLDGERPGRRRPGAQGERGARRGTTTRPTGSRRGGCTASSPT